MKVYEVFILDNWNNIYLIGFFNNLDDAIEKINSHISDEKYYLSKGDLKEYPSTFNNCFDTSIMDVYLSKHPDEEIDDWENDFQIRGFILDKDLLIQEVTK